MSHVLMPGDDGDDSEGGVDFEEAEIDDICECLLVARLSVSAILYSLLQDLVEDLY